MRLALIFPALVLLALVACSDAPSDVPEIVSSSDSDDVGEQKILAESVPAQDGPSVATRSEGGPWVAFVDWDGERDALALQSVPRWDAGPTIVHEPGARVLGTALAVDASDRLHLVWSQEDDDAATGWSLRHLVLAPDPNDPTALGAATAEPARVTSASANDVHQLHPSFTPDDEDGYLLVWQQLDMDGSAIHAARLDGATGEWGDVVSVSRPRDEGAERTGCWYPDAVSTGNGSYAVVWDEATDGDYDVHLARVERTGSVLSVSSRSRVTSSPRFEAQPSVALAPDGERLYVAYHVGPENWGREGSRNTLELALHNTRTIEVVGVEGTRVAPLADNIVAGLNDALSKNCEQPQLHVDGSGTLVLVFRGMPLPTDAQDPLDPAFQQRAERTVGGKGWRTSIWFTFWSALTPNGWSAGDSHHIGVEGGQGRCEAPVALGSLAGGGTVFAVVGDRREREVEQRDGREVMSDLLSWWRPITLKPTGVTPVRVRKATSTPIVALDDAAGWDLAALSDPVPMRAPTTRTTGASTYSLALGDLHRHTDVSRCSSNWDGPISDALRYALDVARLEYMAITDHYEHMLPYDWWRNATWADAYDVRGVFANLRGYERADAKTGHRNVIGRGDAVPIAAYRKTFEPLRDDVRADHPVDLWDVLDPNEVITIPHTPAGMFAQSPIAFNWRDFDPRFDRIVEIFQGYRGSSEGDGTPRAIPGLMVGRYLLPNLDRGLHFGFTAASDHQSSDGAFGGAWVSDVDRDGVFSALHARRTFAATLRTSLWCEWSGNGDAVAMGESAQRVAGPGTLTVEVDGFGVPIERIDVVSDGKRVDVREFDEPVTQAVETFSFDVPAEGERFVYVRVVYEGTELAWSSPIRLGSDAWNGVDGLTGRDIYGGSDADRR